MPYHKSAHGKQNTEQGFQGHNAVLGPTLALFKAFVKIKKKKKWVGKKTQPIPMSGSLHAFQLIPRISYINAMKCFSKLYSFCSTLSSKGNKVTVHFVCLVGFPQSKEEKQTWILFKQIWILLSGTNWGCLQTAEKFLCNIRKLLCMKLTQTWIVFTV